MEWTQYTADNSCLKDRLSVNNSQVRMSTLKPQKTLNCLLTVIISPLLNSH